MLKTIRLCTYVRIYICMCKFDTRCFVGSMYRFNGMDRRLERMLVCMYLCMYVIIADYNHVCRSLCCF